MPSEKHLLPAHFHEDISGHTYVKETFRSRPEIIETYLALALPILKVDLFRYLLLFA
jgi:alpha 1,6-mannosyltransferase